LLAGYRRLWKYLLALPVLIVLGLLSVFRFDRVDGELRPQFSWRWGAAPDLPTVNAPDDSIPQNISVSLESRPTDSNQFLGPTRNATWTDTEMDADWQNQPPEILWRQSIGEGWSSFAVVGDLGVTMEQREQQEWVSAYDVNSGRLIWKHAIDQRYASPIAGNGPRSTPAIHDGRVFACSAVNQFVCLNLQSGALLWARDLNELAGTDALALQGEVEWGRSGSPLVHSGRVIIPLGGRSPTYHSLIALDQQTGDEQWRAGDEQISYSSPTLMTLGGVEQILYVSSQTISSFHPSTGERLWTLEFDGASGQPNVAQPLRLDDGRVFFSKGYGIGSRTLRVTRQSTSAEASSEVKWSAAVEVENRTVLRTKFTNAVLWEDHLYGLSDGILECIDAKTLQRRWKRGRYHQGQVLLLGQHLLITAEDGRLVLLQPDTSEARELASLPVIGDVSWNVPTVSGDRLLMRNATQAACLKLKMTKTNLARSAYQESHEVAFDAGTAAAILGSTIQR
jgi:outer membrane protein assembly factor BamB